MSLRQGNREKQDRQTKKKREPTNRWGNTMRQITGQQQQDSSSDGGDNGSCSRPIFDRLVEAAGHNDIHLLDKMDRPEQKSTRAERTQRENERPTAAPAVQRSSSGGECALSLV
jgi:hypothetical protein